MESGTDVRLVEGLATHFSVELLARTIPSGVAISHPPAIHVATIVKPPGRLAFSKAVFLHLCRLRDEPFDVVLVQGYGIAALAANIVACISRVPTWMLVCSPVEAYYRCRRRHGEPGKPFRRLEMNAIRFFALLNAAIGRNYIVLSSYLERVVRSHGGNGCVAVIPVYGVNTNIFSPSREPKSELKRRAGLPTSGSLIFFSSRIAPEKDSETLLLAMKALIDRGRDIWLLHRSGGFRSFQAVAERFGLGARVIATDASHPHGSLADDYRAADLCIQASREEGLGFSPLEALACEIPVIATAVGGLKETIIDGKTGWTYPLGDSASLARQIEIVLSDPVEAARRAAAGRQLVCEGFDESIVFQRLASVLADKARA